MGNRRGWRAEADETRLADETFSGSTAFGAAFATRGQMLMCKGQFTEGCLLYDRGVALAEFGSDFHIYLLVLKCTAQMGADDRAGVARTAVHWVGNSLGGIASVAPGA